MWIVYLIDASGFDWGHKYFNHEENAQKHFEMLEFQSTPAIADGRTASS